MIATLPSAFRIKIGDNQILSLSKDELISETSKHINVKYHLVRDHAQCGTILLAHTPMDKTIADTLTKPLV